MATIAGMFADACNSVLDIDPEYAVTRIEDCSKLSPTWLTRYLFHCLATPLDSGLVPEVGHNQQTPVGSVVVSLLNIKPTLGLPFPNPRFLGGS